MNFSEGDLQRIERTEVDKRISLKDHCKVTASRPKLTSAFL